MTKADKTAKKSVVLTSHKVIVDSLQPGIKYAYRAGDGQANNFWNHTLQEGMTKFPTSEFILNSGDLVDNGDIEEQWGCFFEKSIAINLCTWYILIPAKKC